MFISGTTVLEMDQPSVMCYDHSCDLSDGILAYLAKLLDLQTLHGHDKNWKIGYNFALISSVSNLILIILTSTSLFVNIYYNAMPCSSDYHSKCLAVNEIFVHYYWKKKIGFNTLLLNK